MPLARFEKMPPDMKERLLEAAGREFAENGYDGASMGRILERARLSKGTAYYYFEDKEDLIATVVRHYWLQFLDETDLPGGEGPSERFWQELEHLYLHPFEHLEEFPWMLQLGRAVWELPESARSSGPLGEVFHEAMAWSRRLLERGQQAGAVRQDLPLELLNQVVLALDSVHDRWLAERWEEMEREERLRFTSTFVDFMRRALGTRQEASRSVDREEPR